MAEVAALTRFSPEREPRAGWCLRRRTRGDYNGAEWPFQCREIAGRPNAVTLHTDGTLSTYDPELQARSLAVPYRRAGSLGNSFIECAHLGVVATEHQPLHMCGVVPCRVCLIHPASI